MTADAPELEAYLSHRAALIDYAAAIVGGRAAAEDVVQGALLRLTNAPPGRRRRHPAAYLFRIVHNLAVDWARRRALESRSAATAEAAAVTPRPAPLPEEVAIQRNRLKVVEDALAELPERTRLAFEMYRLGGYTQQQVADALGISVRLVGMLLSDALTHCRDRLRAAEDS